MMRSAWLLLAALALAGCYREARQLRGQPGTAQPGIEANAARAPDPRKNNKYEQNAYAVSQGKLWFRAYNCGGCHAQGGGNMGPALMDDKWLYGSAPQDIYSSIANGRPNGMPAFGTHIPEDQIWQLVAYVRSMSGQLRSDVAPSRSDSLQAGEPEARRKRLRPVPVPPPKEGKQE